MNVEFADNGVEFQQRHENSGMSFVPDPKPSVFNDEEAAVTYFRECLRKYATFEKEHEG